MKDTISATVVWDFNDDRMAFLPSPGAARPSGAMQAPIPSAGPTIYASDSLVVQFTAVGTDLTGVPPPAAMQPQPAPGPTVSGFAGGSSTDLPAVLAGALNSTTGGG